MFHSRLKIHDNWYPWSGTTTNLKISNFFKRYFCLSAPLEDKNHSRFDTLLELGAEEIYHQHQFYMSFGMRYSSFHLGPNMRVFWNTSYGDFFVFYDITFHRVRRISKESSYRVDFNRIDNFGLGANLFEIILPSPRVFGVVFLRRTFTWIVDRFWVKIFLVYEISVEIYLRYTSVPRNFQNGIKRQKLAKLWHLLPFQKFGRVLFNDYLPFIPKTNFQISSYSQSFSCSLRGLPQTT